MSKGLGAFKLGGRTEKASRVAWPLERLCEVPGCVTPAHHRERGRAAAADRSMALGAPVPWSCSPPTGQAR